LCAALLALTAAAFLPVWANGFVDLDDELYITANPHVLGGLSWSGARWAFTTRHGAYWQPLSWLSLQADAQFLCRHLPDGRAVPSPAAFHGENLLWHAGAALLLFCSLQRLTGARWRSFLVAAAFAVHPLRVESVAWAAERKDVLSTLFGALALWAWARYRERPGWGWYLGVTAAFLLSLLAKPMLMTLPFVLLLLDYWPPRRGTTGEGRPTVGRLIREKVPLLALSVAAAAAAAVARAKSHTALSLADLPLSDRLANAVAGYGWYLASTFYPARLGPWYPHRFSGWQVGPVLAGAAALATLTLLSLLQARRRPWLAVGWLWFVGTLLPVIGLAQGGEQAWADRFSYWPQVGLLVAAAWALGELADRLRLPAAARAAAGALAVGGLGALTWAQVGHWRDTPALWERALAVTEGNHRAHANLGTYHLGRGRLDAAAAHFAEAARSVPGSAAYQYNLGVALLLLGRSGEAAGRFRHALALAPDNLDAWHNLGVARSHQGRPDAAARCFRRVLEFAPGRDDARTELGRALWRLGRREEAAQTFRDVLGRDPQDAYAWEGLGLACLARGDYPAARESFARALGRRQWFPAASSGLGVALGREGRWLEAARCHAQAVQVQEEIDSDLAAMGGRAPQPEGTPPSVLYWCRLGHALRELGDSRAAAGAYAAALRQDAGWPDKFAARAWGLATGLGGARDAREALEWATQAVEAVDDPPALLWAALAVAQMAAGRPSEALRTALRALNKAWAAASLGEGVRLFLEWLHRFALGWGHSTRPGEFASEGAWRWSRRPAIPCSRGAPPSRPAPPGCSASA
jgi:tetratricopeptide (TPR) repeat protein